MYPFAFPVYSRSRRRIVFFFITWDFLKTRPELVHNPYVQRLHSQCEVLFAWNDIREISSEWFLKIIPLMKLKSFSFRLISSAYFLMNSNKIVKVLKYTWVNAKTAENLKNEASQLYLEFNRGGINVYLQLMLYSEKKSCLALIQKPMVKIAVITSLSSSPKRTNNKTTRISLN